MMKTVLAATAALAASASLASAQQLAPSPTLDAIKARGHVECGVHLGLPGFSFADDKGEWTGLDVDYCKALAAAVLGDAKKVKFTPTSVQQRWPILQSGQVDLLSRNSTITFSRNASLGLNFQGINFYEGQTFIVRKATNAKTAADLDGASVCVAAGSTEEKNASDWFLERNLKVTITNFQKNDDAIAAYDAGRCDAYTAGVGALAGQRVKLKVPGDHIILTQPISNDPQGPVTRWGDERWQLIVRWVLNGTIAAEMLGVTSANVDQMKASSKNSEVRRLLGAEGNFGAMMGLSNDWMYNAIKQVGNYGESFERTVGMGSTLKLERGQNQLWTKGGLLFTPPFQ
ncbi:MAG: amino acid ABC transporter substrate-binding protein [Bosea sp. (in: a-proteobacteria)]|uniref:amino acid ABC transporter substrate-binding protein n=1 Tax=Bosea sp. (in: a-proteobacteria) TaxID=1871050 RepID=UPI002732AFEF|nr:amino acid ABC transporter substrate-binding protein [Bosea sp. (in: a-proteobacteria)]MDP3254764.1 amino acid ABC transporter substrate-binding protein [Bosea sp. (in: a-proteobacteria)]MDP3321584.1 amino acid ABC transporter substrate-binding protein [Bosea sp. (in: a-proteobacteria)]